MQMRVVPNQYGQPMYKHVAVPKTVTQSSALAKNLTPPEKPKPLPKPMPKPLPTRKSNPTLAFGIILMVFAIVGVVLSIIGTAVGFSQNFDSPLAIPLLCLVPTILAGALGLLLTILGIVSIGKRKLKYQLEVTQTVQENKNAFQNWQEANERIMQNWQNAIDRWEALYYCHRDDCVFIPGKDRYAPVDKMKQFLFKGLPKPTAKSVVEPQQHYQKPQNSQSYVPQTKTQQRTIQSINRCPNCKSSNVTKPHRQNLSCVWLIFIFFSMGLGLIFWFFTPEYITCNNCKAKWKV